MVKIGHDQSMVKICEHWDQLWLNPRWYYFPTIFNTCPLTCSLFFHKHFSHWLVWTVTLGLYKSNFGELMRYSAHAFLPSSLLSVLIPNMKKKKKNPILYEVFLRIPESNCTVPAAATHTQKDDRPKHRNYDKSPFGGNKVVKYFFFFFFLSLKVYLPQTEPLRHNHTE